MRVSSYLSARELLAMLTRQAQPGDVVVYRKAKFGSRPGPRAKSIHPSAGGDDYSYYVEKYWVVANVGDGGRLELRTRRGKKHTVNADDPLLRPVTWWERLVCGSRFPILTDDPTPSDHAQTEATSTS